MDSELLAVPLEALDPPEQSIRQHIPDELIEELATSIKAVGLIEPMVVKRVGERYQVIAGHRRYLACKRVGLERVQVVVRGEDGIANEAVQVQENVIRQDMTPAEEARLFYRLYQELGEDTEKVAAKVKMSLAYVERRLLFLAGDDLVFEALDREEISMGVAEALNSITREDWRRERLAAAVAGGATVALAKRWAAELNGLASVQPKPEDRNPEAPAEAPYVPVVNSLSCWFCKGTHDLHLLRMVQIHEHCIPALQAFLTRSGKE